MTFDYYLNKDASEVKIEFLDGQGTVLRTFTGVPKTDKAAGAGGGDDNPFGFAAPTRQHVEGHQPLLVGHAL